MCIRFSTPFRGSGTLRDRCTDMNKAELLQQIIKSLSASLAVLEKAARAAHAEATHESSKAENKYDTRGLEAAYLARGQSRQAKEILDSIQAYQKLALRDFAAADGVDLAAVVVLKVDGKPSTFFVGPRHGGLEIDLDGEEITVITPESPLGQQLVGKKAGHRWSAQLGGAPVRYELVAVR